jgi:predicted nuclease of restriction endonuclease-like (RecB) superfamily
LSIKYGKGFSRSNLFQIGSFYVKYPKIQTVSGKLSWSHILELLKISDDFEREFYQKQTVFENWSVRELQRQKESGLFLRLGIGKDKEEILLCDNLQSFLLELGSGFTFVGRQYKITLNNTHYKVDLVFYHRILRCFVLIDLKINEVKHQDIGRTV